MAPIGGAERSERAGGAGAQETAAGTMLVLGWVTLAWGIHRFGRENAD
jgi:hypothetical protein